MAWGLPILLPTNSPMNCCRLSTMAFSPFVGHWMRSETSAVESFFSKLTVSTSIKFSTAMVALSVTVLSAPVVPSV